MITLITGAPGSGKTLYCIDKIIQPLIGTSVAGTDENGQPAIYLRTVYTNINGLMLPHEMVDAQWLEKLPDNKETGAVVVFDEVQRVWPNRPTGSKKPPAVEYLETHRHDGIDVVLLTQNPQLLDPAVRALIGRHLHMRRVGAIRAAVVYEWDQCSNALNFKNAFRKTPYRYSRKVFGLYKSAKVHTKQRRSLPFAVWFAIGGLAAASFLVPKFFGMLEDRKASAQVGATVKPPATGATPAARAASAASAAAPLMVNGATVMTREEYFSTLRPRYMGLPHTAARYDGITSPSRAPVPAACMESAKKGCKCWSQDATPMMLPEPTCKAIVAGGYFVDFGTSADGKPRTVGGLTEVVSQNAVHWKTTGDPRAGAGGMGVQTPHVEAPLPDGLDDVLTAAEIARLSVARTGGNIYAANRGPEGEVGKPADANHHQPP